MADQGNLIISDVALARYWRRVDVRGPDECWPWLGTKTAAGYGNIMVCGKRIYATHIALMLDGRPRVDALQALHSCDNPPCQNPAHLRWGTNADNRADSISRGRHARGATHGSKTKPGSWPVGDRHPMHLRPEIRASRETLSAAMKIHAARGDRHSSKTRPECVVRGERQHRAKLTERDIPEILRPAHYPGIYTALAKQFGVAPGTIWQVRNGRSWTHIAS